VRLVGLCGSLREDSWNRKLLDVAGRLMPDDVEWLVLDPPPALPPYREPEQPDQAEVAGLRARLAAADGVLVATPEYNGSVPGHLKNLLDWASRPFPANCLRGTPVAVVGATTGLFGAIWAQADLRRVLGIIGAQVIDRELAVGTAHEAFSADRLTDDGLQNGLSEIVAHLVSDVRSQSTAAGR
jgi:chromate reductase, NAD(P)H dehydrogenase (quinone)